MKKHLLAVFLLAHGFAFSQNPIPNYNFETWSGTTLTGWYAPSVAGCTKSTQAHGGSAALKMAPWGTSFYGANAYTPATSQGFNLNGLNPTSLTGWYMANFANGDQMVINITIYSGGSSTGTGYAQVTANASSYTQFTVAVYNSSSTADSAKIQFTQFTSGYSASGLSSSTYVIIDDLQFIGSVGIKSNVSPENFCAWFNEAISSLELKAETGSVMNVSLYDLTGKRVVSEEHFQISEPTAKIPVRDLSPGIYLLRAENGKAVMTRKIVIE